MRESERDASVNYMNDVATRNLFLVLIFIVNFVFVNCLLWIVWAREQVKKDLRNKGFAPIRVRWCPFGGWAFQFYTTPFWATYVDVTGCIQTTRCVVVWDNQVRWISDEWTYLNKKLPPIARIIYLAIAAVLIWFGLRCILIGELVVPAAKGNSEPVHLRSWPLILLCFAGFCCAAAFLSELFYCYDGKGRERIYTIFTRGFRIASGILAMSSLAVYFYQAFTK